MGRREVEVTAYAGYRGEERPVSFVLEGEKIGIAEIISRWVEEKAEEKTQKRLFKVKGEDGFTYLLSHAAQTGQWYLE
ncbi:MAG: hypothetical protein EHM54_11045 [Nitrospiraceae bacterium]|nr:MAG: hypothetical protein EHM54_11045 [Nitrospiraceae bacterium]